MDARNVLDIVQWMSSIFQPRRTLCDQGIVLGAERAKQYASRRLSLLLKYEMTPRRIFCMVQEHPSLRTEKDAF